MLIIHVIEGSIQQTSLQYNQFKRRFGISITLNIETHFIYNDKKLVSLKIYKKT